MESTQRPGLFNKVESIMKTLAAIGLLTMALVTGVDVFGRGLLNIPLTGSEEMVSILAVLTLGFTLPYAHSQGSHIGVQFIYERLNRNSRIVIRGLTSMAAAALFGIIAWRILVFGLSLKESGEVSMSLGWPLYPICYALTFCFLVFALFQLRDLYDLLVTRKA